MTAIAKYARQGEWSGVVDSQFTGFIQEFADYYAFHIMYLHGAATPGSGGFFRGSFHCSQS